MKRILLPIALIALMFPLAVTAASAQQTTAAKKTTTSATTSSAKVATTTKATTTAKKTTVTTKAAAPKSKAPATTPEQALRTFSNWVDAKLELNMATVRLDWGTIQSDYTRMTKRLDAATDSLSVQSRREYLGQKARYKAWAAEQGHPVPETVLVGEARDSAVSTVQLKLLNTSAPINRAMASALPDLYSRLVESTRAQHSRWTKANWEEANLVLSRLNDRYSQVGDQLPIEDRVRVRSLQAEFKTLEKARDLKGILDGF
ncbi:hypothetical protein Q3A66_03510 [Hymenobacter sp. BT770]|uniref:DUF6565 domain-containing protein n=1 Tax=Hymenobacter sp. BT770 TaxID=2886942 RepID=UPI001D0FF340|nr:DUF6565 domain-containing protein [Hymenobacter sp. BT770]MCC3152309.1 hypothetical protein [Hymenobacter sp. BT770]MDO3414122.1 hypothetical protein [Hymenobacter sp. BT770]